MLGRVRGPDLPIAMLRETLGSSGSLNTEPVLNLSEYTEQMFSCQVKI